MRKTLAIGTCVLLLGSIASAACISIEEAAKKIGETACVTGKVLKVAQSKGGTYFLDFCEDYRNCPFTVVVFPKDLPNVGAVKLLTGKTIEITGKIEEYRGRAEIVLKDKRQLKGELAKMPPPPKTYDSTRHGTYSAGTFRKKK
jgi:DNA/RNA endonuclease YhcR with UshA esterase domain